MKNLDFENKFCQVLVEEILYLRDRNPEKNWGHIWGLTTVYSYCRWNRKTYSLTFPKDLFDIQIDFIASSFVFLEGDFTDRELYFLKKYNIFSLENLSKMDTDDMDIFPKITTIISWYNHRYLRSYLGDTANDFLLSFLFGISADTLDAHNYYFSFCESIDTLGIAALVHSSELNPDYLFSNIAIAGYFFHHGKWEIAEKYYLHAIGLDEDNPWILGKYCMLLSSSSDFRKWNLAQRIFKKILELLPTSPWVYDWGAEIFIRNCKHIEALSLLTKYNSLTEGKYRTFEPFMKIAEIYLALGNIHGAKGELEKEDLYYFGEGYRYKILEIKEKIVFLENLIN